MSAQALLDRLRAGGVIFRLHHGRVRVMARRGTLTPNDRAELQLYSDALRQLVGPTGRGARDARTPGIEEEPGVVPQTGLSGALAATCGQTQCYFCSVRRFWRSIYGMLVCGACHEPAAVSLVAEWIGPADKGGLADVNAAHTPTTAASGFPRPGRAWS